MRPVNDLVRKDISIGDDHFGAIGGKECAGTQSDLAHAASFIAYLYRITDLKGPVENKNDAGYEVVHDILQAQTDTNTQGTKHDRDLIDRYAGGGDRQQVASGTAISSG